MDKLELSVAKNFYISRSNQIIEATKVLSKDSYGIKDIFIKSKLLKAKQELEKYYGWLNEYDEAYTENLILGGAIPDLNMRNAKLSVVEKARGLFVSSLSSYEKELSNIEASINFKISTTIAFLAFLISVIGVAVA